MLYKEAIEKALQVNPHFNIEQEDIEECKYWKLINCTCKVCGERQQVGLRQLKNKKINCVSCRERERIKPQKILPKDMENQGRKIFGNKYDYSLVRFTKTIDITLIKCNDCNTVFSTSYESHINCEEGCPQCKMNTISLKHQSVNSDEDVRWRLGSIPGFEVISFTRPTSVKRGEVIFRCIKHDLIFSNDYRNALFMHTRTCPECQKTAFVITKGEALLRDIFKSNNILYESEKKFPDLRNDKTNRSLFLDFYLPELNTVVEYHGIQHYVSQPRFSKTNQDSLPEIKRRDLIKKEFCKKNNITYVVLSYYETGKSRVDKDLFIQKLTDYKIL